MTSTAGLIGTTFGGRWRVERALSSGGMGSVYVAVHADTGRKVALKVIKSEGASSPELVARFRKETGALAAVSHPNVVTFLDSGIEEGTFFLVMELLEGKSLRAVMGQALEWKRAFRIAADVCRALAAVHKLGIVHRDLKPENIFLQEAEGHDEIAKLIDFGIVRLHDRQTAAMTQTGSVVGTPGYIAPEQLQGKDASAASDVYAVGVILYELVTGTFPFEAPTPHAMLVRQLMEPLIAPRSALATVPAHVENVILHFMEREPAKRVATAKDALALLVEALQFNESLPPGAATETENDLVDVARAIATAPTKVPGAPVLAAAAAPSATPATRGTAPTGTVIPPSTAPTTSTTPTTPKKRSAGETVLLVAGVVTLGMLGTCGMCVAAAKSCGGNVDDTGDDGSGGAGGAGGDDGQDAPSGPAAIHVDKPEKPNKPDKPAKPSVSVTDRPDGKKNVHLNFGNANLNIDGADVHLDAPGVPSFDVDGNQDDSDEPLAKSPSGAQVKEIVKAQAEPLRECGARGPKPAKLQITLTPDGEFVLDTPPTGPVLACAAAIVSTWEGPEFRGKPVTVTIALPLGR